jgi:hypothetical protein
MKRYRRTAASQYLIVTLIIVSIVGFGLLNVFVMSRVPFTDHFVIPWAAGRSWLLEAESPYAPSVLDVANDAIDESVFLAVLPETQILPLPLLSLLFFLPFSLIPYAISRVIWVTILAISISFIVFLSIQLAGWKLSVFSNFGVFFTLLLWLPSAAAILNGQLSPIIIALTLIGISLVINGQDTSAGFILALTFSSAASIGLVLLILLVWSISHKRWSLMTSFFSGVIFLLVVSWLILPAWFMDWASVMLNLYSGWDWINTPLMSLASLLPGIADFLSIFLHAAFILYGLTILITLLGKSGRVFIYKMFGLFIIVYLVNIQGTIIHLLLVVPAMLMVFRFWSERWKLFGNIVSWGTLFLVSFGSWLLIFSKIDFTTSFDVPLLSIGYPLFVLMGLFWIRWWALRIPAMPYEIT